MTALIHSAIATPGQFGTGFLANNAVIALESSDDLPGLDWDVLLEGNAEIREGKLVPVSAIRAARTI